MTNCKTCNTTLTCNMDIERNECLNCYTESFFKLPEKLYKHEPQYFTFEDYEIEDYEMEENNRKSLEEYSKVVKQRKIDHKQFKFEQTIKNAFNTFTPTLKRNKMPDKRQINDMEKSWGVSSDKELINLINGEEILDIPIEFDVEIPLYLNF